MAWVEIYKTELCDSEKRLSEETGRRYKEIRG